VAAVPSPLRSRIVGHGEEAPDQLLANPRNWRIHPKAQQNALSAVLEEVGWVQQVIVNQTTGYVVDGHLRVALALSRQESTVPVVYVELTPEEEALILASLDPLAGMAGTDQVLLDDLLADLVISDTDLAELLGKGNGHPVEEDEVPEPPADPVTKPGDLWLLGEHRLMCGDSFDGSALDRLFGGAKVGCVLTDPPYGIDLDTDFNQPHGRVSGRTYRPIIGDGEAFDAGPLRTRLADVAEQFWFGANYYRSSLGANDRDGSWLVWDKRTPETDVVVGSGFELCWSAVPHQQLVLRFMWTNYTSQTNAGHRREHPAEKPVALLADILDRWTPVGCVVVDPFGGSGTTMVAAHQQGRTAYLMEIDPAYCDVIVKRWENLTGEEATRADPD
jgi:DNA modification methylase